MAQAAPLAPTAEPRVINGKYRLETMLSEGGMGSVWRAMNLQLELRVAIKLLKAGLDPDALGERLRVEARAAAKLVHPNIVRIFDIGEAESGEPFIVMELLDGESLGDRLEHGALPPIEAVQLLLPIADALALSHSRGVIHRDLKPDNIFLSREDDWSRPKLLDFGIAKVTSSGKAALSQSGMVLGSPSYMSPEQASGRADIDHRTDVWSFCAVLHEAIVGRPAFDGATVQEILRSVVHDPPLSLAVAAGIDRGLAELIKRGLSKERELRPGSMGELGQQLAAWLIEQGVHEDATGASLESKWLARTTPLGATALAAVTLPSAGVVARPERGRSWHASVPVAFAALALFGWGSPRAFDESSAITTDTARFDPTPPTTEQRALVATVSVDTLPVESPAVPSPAATVRLVQPNKPVKRAPSPVAAPVARDPAADLLSPY